jgi:uncharacterized membrane protein (DUF106 family)
MDPEIKRLLEETKALAKDNHQMLRSIRRRQMYSVVWTIVVWAFVLLAPFYLYQQYLQPFISKFQATGTTTSSDIGNLLNLLKVGQ